MPFLRFEKSAFLIETRKNLRRSDYPDLDPLYVEKTLAAP
jgi:hypothetical protein